MTDFPIKKDLLKEVDKLGIEGQKKVLEFARSLTHSSGVPGKHLLSFAGTIDKEDLDRISRAIEEECERVNPDEW